MRCKLIQHNSNENQHNNKAIEAIEKVIYLDSEKDYYFASELAL